MKKAIVVILSLAFVASVSFAFAEELAIRPESAGNNSRQSKEERTAVRNQWKLERQAALDQLKQQKEEYRATRKQELTETRCARIEEKIQNQTSKLGTAKVKHMSVYLNMQNRIQKFIDRFDAFYLANPGEEDATNLNKLKKDFGYSASTETTTTDTTAVVDTTAPTTLKSLIDAFQTSLTDFTVKLGAAKKTTCQSTEGELQGTLADTRVYLKSVHDNAAAIRTFVRGTILPDLLAVKKDIASLRGEAGGENEAEEADEPEEDDGEENQTAGDTVLPTVSITGPAVTTYTEAATVTISADAADDIGITKVEFIEGGEVKGSATVAPYSYSWSFTGNGEYTWTAKAYDAAENTATSLPVTLTVNIPAPIVTTTP